MRIAVLLADRVQTLMKKWSFWCERSSEVGIYRKQQAF